jgi:hypothetical protein
MSAAVLLASLIRAEEFQPRVQLETFPRREQSKARVALIALPPSAVAIRSARRETIELIPIDGERCMNDPLSSYLHDHLAGSHFAINLLDSLHDQYRGEELGNFASNLCAEIKRDQQILEQIIQRVGKPHLDLPEAAGWLAEKASQIKLHRDHKGVGLGTYEAFETLSLGIRGKLALWRALSRIRDFDKRIPAQDFEQLAERAEDQYAQVEQRRLQLIPMTFGQLQPK